MFNIHILRHSILEGSASGGRGESFPPDPLRAVDGTA